LLPLNTSEHVSVIAKRELPFSDGALSPVSIASKEPINNFVNVDGVNRSIYNIFRRSKHKLYEIEEKSKRRRKVNSISNNIEKPKENQFYKPEDNSVYQAFKRNQDQIKI